MVLLGLSSPRISSLKTFTIGGKLKQAFTSTTLQVTDDTELEALCAEISSQHYSGESPDSPSRPCCTFTYVTMTGEEVELAQGGRSLAVR